MSSAMSHSLFGCSERLGKQRLKSLTQGKTDQFTLSGEKFRRSSDILQKMDFTISRAADP
jgi:hypothetical protein